MTTSAPDPGHVSVPEAAVTATHFSAPSVDGAPRVALVSEGTYPFAMGGVSVWCDQLMRGLTDHVFEFVALTVNDSARPLWEPPANLDRLHVIPLWTPSAPHGRRIGRQAEDAVADLVEILVQPMPDDPVDAGERVSDFLAALRRVGRCARARGGTAGLFTVDRAVRLLGSAWQRRTGTTLSLRDALEWGDLVEHLLRPLQGPIVRADIVHASMNGPAMLVAMAAHWERGTPVVLSEHGTYLRERYLLEQEQSLTAAARFLRLSFFRHLAAASYQVATAIAPHSHYNRRWQLRCGADPAGMHTMYNGVSLGDFPVAEREPELPTVSFLGRIDPVKDVRTLVRAFAVVRRSMPAARLRIFGTAPVGQEAYLQECRALVTALDLDDSVVFEGHAAEPSEAYHAGSVVALSSISEGFPFTVVEAMACGRSVVCTDVGGVAEAVGDAGLVVRPQDPEALGRALLAVLDDDERRSAMARRARLRVDERFTAERWTAAYGRLYAQVVGRTAEPSPRSAEPAEAVLTS